MIHRFRVKFSQIFLSFYFCNSIEVNKTNLHFHINLWNRDQSPSVWTETLAIALCLLFILFFFSHFADTGIYRSFLPTAKHHISTINKCIRSRSVFVMQLIYEDSEVRVAYTHDIRFVFFLRCLCALLPAMKQTYLWLLFNKVITATASIWIFLR